MGTASILLVEDEDGLAEVLERTLVAADYQVTWAKNGKEALRIYDPQKFNMVLTDLIMPEKEGLELISELKRTNPAIKIIAMSGGGTVGPHSYLSIAQRFGAMQLLAKPFSSDELLAVVEAVLLSKDNGQIENLS